MNVILLQTLLLPHEIDLLLMEFPQFLFLSLTEVSYKNLTPEHWGTIEVIFGPRLTEDELKKARQLHWIHCPTASLNRLCLQEIEKRDQIMISNTLEENSVQTGEFAMGCVLALAKNLFVWKEAQKSPSHVWGSKWRDSMLSLPNKIFLQIGLSRPGIEIARQAGHFGMKVWGVEEKASFHPFCRKNFSYESLPDILPRADVISIYVPKNKKFYNQWKKEHLDQMKEGAILLLLGSNEIFTEEDLAAAAQSGKFRGIIVDAPYQSPIAETSPLWNVPGIMITPEVAPRPKSLERTAFRLFLYNLRQYVFGNFKDMRNVVFASLHYH